MKPIRGYYMPDKRAEIEAEELFVDFYKRQKEHSGVVFDVDTEQYTTVIKDLRSREIPENREKWEYGFDIDFCIEFKQEETQAAGAVYHEVKSYARTLGNMINEKQLWNPSTKQYEWVKMRDRGIISLEIVGNMENFMSGRELEYDIPGTDQKSAMTVGASCFFKSDKRANWYHFYLPVGNQNEGRTEATPEEIQYMQKYTKQGSKIVIEAPAGLYISMTRDVTEAYIVLALEEMARRLDNTRSLEERRAVLEEYFHENTKGQKVVDRINVRIHVTKLLEAQEKARINSGRARLEVRPVFKIIRNDKAAEEEIEIASNGAEYYMPQRLKDIYFNEYGQPKSAIQGYWNDAPTRDSNGIPGRGLLDICKLIIQDTRTRYIEDELSGTLD